MIVLEYSITKYNENDLLHFALRKQFDICGPNLQVLG